MKKNKNFAIASLSSMFAIAFFYSAWHFLLGTGYVAGAQVDTNLWGGVCATVSLVAAIVAVWTWGEVFSPLLSKVNN